MRDRQYERALVEPGDEVATGVVDEDQTWEEAAHCGSRSWPVTREDLRR